MKIAQVCPYNYSRPGGVKEHIYYLSRHLRKRGHIVKIITPEIEEGKVDEDDIIYLGKVFDLSVNKTQTDFSIVVGDNSNTISDILTREKFDVIHFQEPASPVMPMQILHESDTCHVATFHASLPDTILSKYIEIFYSPLVKTVIKYLHGLIAVTEVPQKYIQNYTKREIPIVPNGICLDVFNTLNKPFKKYIESKKIKILFFGRIDKRKGIMHLLKVYRKLRANYKNIQLIVGGKGDDLNKAKRYVKKRKLKGVEFLGFVSEDDKPRIYASCDIFCSPAISGESQGIVLLEAMASGKPVVAYANSGYKTVLKNDGSKFLAKPKDKKMLYKKLELLVKDEKLREKMGKWGVEEAKKYSWEMIAEKIEVIYKNAIANKNESTAGRKSKKTVKEIIKSWLKKVEFKKS